MFLFRGECSECTFLLQNGCQLFTSMCRLILRSSKRLVHGQPDVVLAGAGEEINYNCAFITLSVYQSLTWSATTNTLMPSEIHLENVGFGRSYLFPFTSQTALLLWPNGKTNWPNRGGKVLLVLCNIPHKWCYSTRYRLFAKSQPLYNLVAKRDVITCTGTYLYLAGSGWSFSETHFWTFICLYHQHWSWNVVLAARYLPTSLITKIMTILFRSNKHIRILATCI